MTKIASEKTACERCGEALPLAHAGAWVCSFQCTFCSRCSSLLQGSCPNCGGELLPRPRRGVRQSEPLVPSPSYRLRPESTAPWQRPALRNDQLR